MDEIRKNAYKKILAAGLLHLKWDLGPWVGKSRWWVSSNQAKAARHAAQRAALFHNLAIFSTMDFEEFSEERFWSEVEHFHQAYPELICPYLEIFQKCLNGEPTWIISPNGGGIPQELS